MSIAIDLALIIFIIISISLASNRGFVYSLITFVGYIAAALTGFALSGAAARYVTDGFLRGRIIDKIALQMTTESVESISDALDGALPGFLSGGLSDGVLEKYVGQGSRTVAEVIFDNAVSPVLLGIIRAAFSVIVLSLLFYVIRRIARVAKSVIRHTFLSSVDKAFGGAFGFAKGVVIIICTMFIVHFAMLFGSGHVGPLSLSDIDNSLLFRFFYRDLLSL